MSKPPAISTEIQAIQRFARRHVLADMAIAAEIHLDAARVALAACPGGDDGTYLRARVEQLEMHARRCRDSMP